MRSPLLAAILLVSFILASAVGLYVLMRGAGRIQPLDCLPEETRFFVNVKEPPAFGRALARTRLGATGSEEAGALWAAAAAILARAMEARGIEVGLTPDELAGIFRTEILLAEVPSGKDERGALVLIAGTTAGADKTLSTFRDLARERVPGYADTWWTERRHRGFDYLTLRSPAGAGPLCVANLRGLLVVSTSGASLRSVLDVAAERAGALRRTSIFTQGFSSITRNADLVMFGSGAWLRSTASTSSLLREGSAGAGLIGLPSVHGAGLAVHIRGDLFHEALFVTTAADRRGLADPMLGTRPRPPRPGPLARARFPFFATTSSARLDAILERLPELIGGATLGPSEPIRERLEGLEQFLAIDLGRELTASFGEELTIGLGPSSVWPRAGEDRPSRSMPAFVEVSLRDPEAAARLLGRVDGLARAFASLRTEVSRGERTTWYEIASIAPLRPAYRITRTHLMAATAPDLLDREATSEAGGGSGARREEIERLLEMLMPEAHIYFGADTARLVDLVDPVRACRAMPDPLARILLPALRETARGRDPVLTLAAARLESGGVMLEWVGPVSPSLLLALRLACGGEDNDDSDEAVDPEDATHAAGTDGAQILD